ncbi:MAG: hypothetical protein JRG73_05785 [Deltaproteobacteria bacterium]|nr:hypothetical protein [Deltaproteobacteria bacterium]MBW2306432.1 hypothetical protein [Deltaproteobacteria bacterium]
MLNRKFFENEFPAAVKTFASQKKCENPFMEFVLYSGQTFMVLKILKIEERWIQVEALTEDRESTHVFIPYKNIARLCLYTKAPPRGSLGF